MNLLEFFLNITGIRFVNHDVWYESMQANS